MTDIFIKQVKNKIKTLLIEEKGNSLNMIKFSPAKSS